MAPAVALGGRRLIPVLVTPRRSPGARPDERFGAAVEQLADAFLENAYNTDRKLLLERNKTALRREDPTLRVVELFEAIRPGSSRTFNAGSYLYFERKALLAMHEAGQLAARAWLDRGPPGDSPEKDDLCFGLVALSHVSLVAQLFQPELLPVAAAPSRGAPVLEDSRAGATGRLGEGVSERRPRLAMQGGHGAISSRAPPEGRGGEAAGEQREDVGGQAHRGLRLSRGRSRRPCPCRG